MSNPWLDPTVAKQQRALLDKQLQERPWPPHFDAYAEAIRATACPGELLEIGCGTGAGREILDRAGVEYRSFSGVDISPTALVLAAERYPESTWTLDLAATYAHRHEKSADVVIDGSCVLHVDDWRAHLAALCRASRRWVILHRVPVSSETTRTETHGYGHTFPAWSFARADLDDEMRKNGCSMVWKEFKADGDSVTLVYV